jgi:hypothetical protein
MSQNLYETFRLEAIQIAKQMDMRNYTGLGIQEETLSDNLLLRIQYKHEENFLTRKFTKKEEGNFTGADWLWCIGEPGSWITFAVQAKIMNQKTGRINYLHYRHGEQYAKLIYFCRRFNFIPKYSIYSKINQDTRVFAMKTDELKNIPSEQWSFSMVSPKYVKNLSTPNEKHISNVLEFAVPWSYIFCTDERSSKTLADGIAQNLEAIYWVLEKEFRVQQKQKARTEFSRTIWENPQPARMITKDIPLFVLYLLTQDMPRKIPISRVGIFSTVPIQGVLKAELLKIENQRRWKNFENTLSKIRELEL